MASWMVHLRIADELLNRIDDLDETAFVLGNIAPDSGVPNEDWSVFTPPTNVTHFKTKPEERTFIDIDKFITEYFSSEAINGYTQKEYSFFLGYYTHLLTDIEWSKMVREEGVTEENAAKEGMSYQDFIWKNKEDWYDLDFRYLADNPEFRAFRIYEEADNITNVFMDIFAEDAFENRREYICGYYRSDDHGDLYRDYKYLSKERYDSFVDETVGIIKTLI
ncbi:Zinc dependent phospholipase C [Pseudobutyrivibrio sp. 49]|uniref:zinc dependent phospholipase C family protein n=1 Tax=unclassified Pseudobutyrivibrio TaxID=2638619 RepID=UPI00088DA66F|nr:MULTISPECIES: zinc dependent phospholipase C family protein [unclassified Pseudobutyrivibrio]SDI75792.1 Zinc dependent phospholipase C [Pseudobutyrivibrio sp. 49]SFN97552.1 Zinc dependent phospholipase C [Pseudobutyrivibrio sp. UC1225]